MVLVLQRRVLVMGPRIILRGAIPIDSNIGGSSHRPPCRVWVVVYVRLLVGQCFLEVVLLFLPFLSCVLALSWFTVLPWLAKVLPQELVGLCLVRGPPGARYYRYFRGRNFLLPLNERYYRPACGTSAWAVLLQ